MCGSDKACFGKAVAEHEASFGIGVIDHDRLSVLGGKDVAWQYGLVADGVFGEAAHGAYLDRKFQCCDGLDRGKYGSGSAHIANHLGHGFRRLEAETARIKREALADKDQMVCGCAHIFIRVFTSSLSPTSTLASVVAKRNHVRLVRAALADSHMSHEAFLFELLHVANLDRKPRSKDGCACVDQILGEDDCLVFNSCNFCNLLEFSDLFTSDNFERDLESFLLLALVGVELVVCVMQSKQNALELFWSGIGKHDGNDRNLALACFLGEAVCCHTQVVQ